MDPNELSHLVPEVSLHLEPGMASVSPPVGSTGEVDVLPEPEDAHRHRHRPLPSEAQLLGMKLVGLGVPWRGTLLAGDAPWTVLAWTFSGDLGGTSMPCG